MESPVISPNVYISEEMEQLSSRFLFAAAIQLMCVRLCVFDISIILAKDIGYLLFASFEAITTNTTYATIVTAIAAYFVCVCVWKNLKSKLNSLDVK